MKKFEPKPYYHTNQEQALLKFNGYSRIEISGNSVSGIIRPNNKILSESKKFGDSKNYGVSKIQS